MLPKYQENTIWRSEESQKIEELTASVSGNAQRNRKSGSGEKSQVQGCWRQ